jgi:hypothetical protein
MNEESSSFDFDLNLKEIILEELMNEIIRQSGGKYCLFSKKINPKTGKRRNLGCYGSKSGAKQREREVQYFKHK